MKNKKGSMELGVNAIVVLIIALVILGLAIAFVTNLFRSSGEQLGGILSNTELPVHASQSEPIKFETTEIRVKQGKTVNVKVSIYNDGFASGSFDVRPELVDCQDSTGAAISGFSLNTPYQRISPGTDVGYLAVLKAPDTANAETHICTIRVTGDSNQITGQIIVEVTL